jgi:tetratricopeptide (TPR) repeat protein
MIHKLTLVTCLFDLGRREDNPKRQSVNFYLEHGRAVLGLDCEMLVFVDPDLVEPLQKSGIDLSRKKILACNFEDLPTYQLRAKIEEARKTHPLRDPNVIKDTPLYGVFQRAKIQLLRRALDLSDATHFAWIDFGIAKAVPVEHAPRAFAEALLLKKVELLVTGPLEDGGDWQAIRHGVLAGYIPGDRSSVEKFCVAYEQVADRVLADGFAPHDERLLEAIAAPGADYLSLRRVTDHTRIFADFAPLLGLVMIVKNEAKRIVEVLASYRPYIDAWTILDTGSTDGTQDLIRKELDGIAGVLHEEPFVDFATSRNRALELHGTSTVFSIMPNGDVLSGGAELVSFLEAHRRDLAGAYRVRIAPGHYYHPLVMRTGFGWRYKWRTHECAMGPNVGEKIPGVTVVRDRGARTSDEWRARWMRDLDLLNLDRVADPNDPRPYFYLGQTHECLGEYAQALEMFEKRATMGGYFDEVYEAKFRIGKMKDKLSRPWAEIQQAYLEAYAHDSRRAEPLYAISQYWYDKNIHAVSRLFAVAAAETPKPLTDLFLDEAVYTWKSADRAAISSYYFGRKEDGRYWAEIALSWKSDDERLRSNRAFFARSAIALFGAEVRAIDFLPEPGWNASNPSIYFDGDRTRCVVRTVNYKIVNGSYATLPGDVVGDDVGRYKGWQVIRTRNFLLDLDTDLKTTRVVEIVDKTGDERTSYPIHGFEDARLFVWRGSWWATATVCDFTEDGRREIALLQIDDDGAVVRADPLRGPYSVYAQKNWMPLVDGDVAKFIYATSLDGDVGSTMIFDLVETDDPEALPRYSIQPPTDATYGHGRLRGGSQAVRVDGGWIFVVHDVTFPGGSSRMYLHRFVFIDEKLQLVSMTDPFYFEKLGIEFCAGLALMDGKLVASYAVNDGSARLGIFDWQRVRRSLRKDFVI